MVTGIDHEVVIISIKVVSTYTYDIPHIVMDYLPTPLLADLRAFCIQRLHLKSKSNI